MRAFVDGEVQPDVLEGAQLTHYNNKILKACHKVLRERLNIIFLYIHIVTLSCIITSFLSIDFEPGIIIMVFILTVAFFTMRIYGENKTF